MLDDQLGPVNKRLDAYLYPSEIVTIGLLFALKDGRFCAFESRLNKNYRACFPHLPERTRLQRLLRDCAEQAFDFLDEQGFCEKNAPTQNIQCCARGTWNERFTIETNLSWVTELFHAKRLYHRVKEHLETHLWYLAALINCLLRITEPKRSLAEFVI
jgi:hypothetical protein